MKSIGQKLLKRKESIAVAESVTSGMLQLALSAIPDAACFYQGGITAYNLGQKYKHLQVEPIHASSVNCVSEKVAIEMALQICELYSSDWGIAITGYASPVPESAGKLFAFFAIVHREAVKAKGRIDGRKGDPQELQVYYAKTVMNKLLRII